MAGWRRTYWAVWAANLITSIGMMSFLPFFPSLLEEMGVADETAKRAWAGAIFGAAPLSATLMSPIWGAIGDRIGRKLMVCRAMLAISLFIGCMYWASTPLTLLLLRLGQGLFSGFVPPSITLVSVGAPAERQGRVAGDLTTALAIGGILGPSFGGWLAATSGSYRTVFLFVAGAGLVGALLVSLLAVEDAGHRQRVDGGLSVRTAVVGMARDVAAIFANPVLRGAALLVFALQFGLGSINPVLELYVRELVDGRTIERWSWLLRHLPSVSLADERGIEVLATGLLFGAMAVCNLVSLPAWGRYGDRVGHRRALALCALGSVLALGLQASAQVFALLLAGRMLMGAAMAGTGPLAFGLAAAEISADRRGGAFGVVFSARTLAVAVGGLTGGVLSSVIGVRGIMVVALLILVGALAVFRRGSAARE